MDNMTIY